MSEEDAIQEDVSAEEVIVDAEVEETSVDEEVGSPLSKRDEVMDAIIQNRRAETQQQEEEEEDLIEEENSGAPVYEKDGKWYAKRKVNGQEEEVEFETILAQNQKEVAADQKLEQASNRLREVELKEQSILHREQELRNQQYSQPSTDAAYDEPSTDAQQNGENQISASDLTEAIFNGEEDKVTELFDNMMSRRSEPATNRAEIVNEAVAQLREEQEIERANDYEGARIKALAEVETDNADIMDDPDMRMIANARSGQLYQEDPSRSPKEILQEACDLTREKYLNTSATPNKLERKRNQSKLHVKPRNAKSNIGQDAPPKKTNSDIIAEMKSNRGQSM